tara:strand:+ start:145 stop:318 length:174 start_codon:yes stop_codon:yes gene_type:complete
MTLTKSEEDDHKIACLEAELEEVSNLLDEEKEKNEDLKQRIKELIQYKEENDKLKKA